MKKFIPCLLILLLILTLSACQNGTPDPTPTLEITDNDTEPTDNDQPSNGAVEGEEKPPTPALPEREQPTEDDLELVGLILYNHDLTDSDFLESRTVTGPSGAEYPVTVITGGFGEANVPSQLFWEHDAIVLLYELWYDTEDLWFDDIETAHDLIASLLMERMSWLGSFTETGGISLTVHIPFYVSADGDSVFVGFGTEFMGRSLLFLYFAQAIPDSDYILSLELMLNLDILTQEDMAILEELSHHMGFDFLAYLP